MTRMSTEGETMARRMAAGDISISRPSTSSGCNSTINPKGHHKDSRGRTTMRRGRCLAMNDSIVHARAHDSRYNVYSSHL